MSNETETKAPALELENNTQTLQTVSTVPAQVVVGQGSQFADAFGNVQRIARLMFESGLFEDTKSMAQAAVKILAGQEMRMGPYASMRDINIIKGKTGLAGSQIAARIKQSREYDYEVVVSDDTRAVLRFTRNGKPLNPDIEFNIEHAKRMDLAGKDNYRKQPGTMLFWRALTKGARMHCPHLFGGAVYTPEELGAVTNEQGEVLSVPTAKPEGELTAKLRAAAEAKKAPAPEPQEEPHLELDPEQPQPEPDWKQIAAEVKAREGELNAEQLELE